MKRYIEYTVPLGDYTLHISPDLEDSSQLLIWLSWTKSGNVKHEGVLKHEDLAEAIADMIIDPSEPFQNRNDHPKGR